MGMQGILPLAGNSVAGKDNSYFFHLYKMPLQGTMNTEGGGKGMIRWLEQHFLPFAFPWFDSLSPNPGVG